MFDGKLDESSNFGAGSVDIAAPGTFILGITPDNGYAFMRAPPWPLPWSPPRSHALYLQTGIKPYRHQNVILASARKMDSLNGKVLSGGMLDANGGYAVGTAVRQTGA